MEALQADLMENQLLNAYTQPSVNVITTQMLHSLRKYLAAMLVVGFLIIGLLN